MKQIIVCLLSVTCWLACTAREDAATSLPADSKNGESGQLAAAGVAIRKSLSDVPVNRTVFCGQRPPNGCAGEVDRLRAELTRLNPVPIPQSNTRLPISIEEADRRYRQFAAAHRGEPILAVFQQYFPRVLLNRYGIITGTNYSRIAYYTQQLAEAKSYDLATQTNALTVLRSHLPANEFNRLLSRVIANARDFRRNQQPQIDRTLMQLADTAGKEADVKQFLTLGRSQLAPRLLAQKKTVDQAAAQLAQMQGQPAD